MVATIAAVLCTGQVAAAASTVVLDVDFEALPLGQIGTGGAAVGEPISVSVASDELVVDAGAPMPTKSLELTDQSTSLAGTTTFEFLDDVELTRGIVTISFDLWIEAFDKFSGYSFNVREQGSSSRSFVSYSITESGATVSGAGDPFSSTPVPPTGQVAQVEFVFDMEALTVSYSLDGVEHVTDRYHGIADRGIGRINVGMSADVGTGDRWYVDNLLVIHEAPAEQIEWLSADFEDQTDGLVVGTGGADDGEPIAVDTAVDAIVRAVHRATQQLEVIDDSTTAAGHVAFGLLGDTELEDGGIRVRFGLLLEDEATYRILFLDGTSSLDPANALFVVSFEYDSTGGTRSFEVTDQSPTGGGSAFLDSAGDRFVIDRGQSIRLEALIDLDSGTYSLTWDGENLISDRDYNQPTRSFGRLVLRVDEDADTGDSFHIDNVLVEELTTIFSDGFESGDSSQWL